jgi:hypothetical protein
MQKKLNYLLVSVITTILCAVSFFGFLYITNMPKPVTEFERVTLGMAMDEVMYNLGYPEDMLYEDTITKKPSFIKGKWLAYATKEERDKNKTGARDYLYWQYPSKNTKDTKRIDVEFDTDTKKVVSIGCYVQSNAWVSPNTCAINGIQALDTEEIIVGKLGKPSKEVIDGITKTMQYEKYNMEINLEQRYAYYIVVKKLGK